MNSGAGPLPSGVCENHRGQHSGGAPFQSQSHPSSAEPGLQCWGPHPQQDEHLELLKALTFWHIFPSRTSLKQ